MGKAKKSTGIVLVTLLTTVFAWSMFPASCFGEPQSPKKADADSSYTLEMKAVKKDKTHGDVVLKIVAAEGYEIKPPTPLKINLTPSQGVTLTKTKLGWDEAKAEKKKKVEVKTGYTLGGAATKGTVEGKIRFALCDSKGCYLKNVKHSLTIP